MVDVPSPVLEKIIRTKYEAFGQTFDAALTKNSLTRYFPCLFCFLVGSGGVTPDSIGAARSLSCDSEIVTIVAGCYMRIHDC